MATTLHPRTTKMLYGILRQQHDRGSWDDVMEWVVDIPKGSRGSRATPPSARPNPRPDRIPGRTESPARSPKLE